MVRPLFDPLNHQNSLIVQSMHLMQLSCTSTLFQSQQKNIQLKKIHALEILVIALLESINLFSNMTLLAIATLSYYRYNTLAIKTYCQLRQYAIQFLHCLDALS